MNQQDTILNIGLAMGTPGNYLFSFFPFVLIILLPVSWTQVSFFAFPPLVQKAWLLQLVLTWCY